MAMESGCISATKRRRFWTNIAGFNGRNFILKSRPDRAKPGFYGLKSAPAQELEKKLTKTCLFRNIFVNLAANCKSTNDL